MSVDLEKLSPAPWQAHGHELYYGSRRSHQQIPGAADAWFIALARNAFDVMMRRGWGVEPDKGRWIVCNADGDIIPTTRPIMSYVDPFTALVEADAWYLANVESGKVTES